MRTTINFMNDVMDYGRVLSNRDFYEVSEIFEKEAGKYCNCRNQFNKNLLCNIVLHALSNLGNDETIHLEQILNELPPFINMALLKDTLTELCYRGYIMVLGSYVKILNIPLIDYMNSLPTTFAKKVVEGRLAGESINEIKETYNLTDLQYNDCLLEIFENRPKLEEEVIYELYLQFDIEVSDLHYIFQDEPEETWILLEMLQSISHYDKYPLEEILHDEMLEDDERERIIEIIKRRESNINVA